MNIVIIGTGNTASVLGRRLKAAGHEILQVYGRNAKTASDLAYELDTESTNYWSVVNREADIYLIAVSDIAIAEVVQELQLSESTVVHTAASVPLNVLEGTAHQGVFYPLQTLKKELGRQPDIPIIIDASDAATLDKLDELAHSITHHVMEADDATRLKLHVAAVFCNNFVNHLYVLMADYCQKEGLDFALLQPLIAETAQRINEIAPLAAQTGPAIRQDTNTIARHLEVLNNHPALAEWYQRFTLSIQNQKA
ncbi:Predicted oxidoreductase, contains short-chain dehydrogenase (SDR) and DUF2520 domains [Cnuella takakiae]|uniref:Predicted oxidoreductase, contains short-chain dehydrogenase (SDR) and DUF2520 domains n=1 Tax=Cnuella takakiae TaxID=1302690 RepID=A0A1M4V0S1_9BACT|nr:DUF2520 domain-containing protein [Cnuella takakiae]OLY92740.1 hypothetical protein BUE76_13210 [Cnuella takakiae]SHE62498.1 Predicted oxidoreductase, contains short-chain dehydrogenase (SDR) and DUF2520 domains [Cnuella takakiae]